METNVLEELMKSKEPGHSARNTRAYGGGYAATRAFTVADPIRLAPLPTLHVLYSGGWWTTSNVYGSLTGKQTRKVTFGGSEKGARCQGMSRY
jgi:hypothetical protein